MAKKPTPKKTIESLKHAEDKRAIIPTAEYEPVLKDADKSPLRAAYARRNLDLDPQLVWRGKDNQNLSDLVVYAPPLYIQEKVQPKALIDDLLRQTKEAEKLKTGPDLFADFNGIPEGVDKTEFYKHSQNWSNRMILGDSLQVMSSLLEREGLRGQVQCIYIDPPYGIRFNSNFQWSTTSKDIKDGKTEHITREPEQVKAFRDTWKDGIHSYLTYLRERLTVVRDLLSDTGSLFVQIGDENVHRVRALMDEIFDEENFLSQIAFKKTGFQASNYLPNNFDFILWYSKNYNNLKFRRPYIDKLESSAFVGQDVWFDDREGRRRRLTKEEKNNLQQFSPDNIFRHKPPESAGAANQEESFSLFGRRFQPKDGKHFSITGLGRERTKRADRFIVLGNSLRYIEYLSGFSVTPITNFWSDTVVSGFADPQVYVVQTSNKVIERCLLMATDPGDLVLDPTCGSGTTAFVAEQWGRRWITIDTSRVALALARARIMGARYPYYLLADSEEGKLKEGEITDTVPSSHPVHGNIRQGFVYERVPHITLKSIANNAEIDVIWEKWQATLEPLREQLNDLLKLKFEEWEIPREVEDAWPARAHKVHSDWWKARIARQKEIDASIAAKAEMEYLYDKPYENKKIVRVAGPFTVESISPHRILGVDENDELIDPDREDGPEPSEGKNFLQIILENLKTAGVQQAHKEDKIEFSSLTPWPGTYVCGEGTYYEGKSEKRAAIFIGPEFGTVQRADLVSAAREAGESNFDVLIACAFNYEAHATEFSKMGKIPILKARMNADLHMAGELKNTGKGNLFVIFGEPDISVVSGQWLVTKNGRMIANYEQVKELSGFGSLEEINRAGRDGLSSISAVSAGGKVRVDQPDQESGGINIREHRGGGGAQGNERVSPVPGNSERIAGGDGDLSHSRGKVADDGKGTDSSITGTGGGRWSDAQRAQTLSALKNLSPTDFPLFLTTDHKAQVTIHGVDVFHPNTGEVRSDNADGIACWFIDTDYNEESFFVRHAYFLGANDPYSALKTTLKAEIDEAAWATLHSDTSRPFDKPKSGRIAVKVINHLGDEVMKVFRV
jgi:adenine-specific DNA-methyltransferase